MKLAVGDVVVYGNHGIGRIAARREQAVLGATREVVVIELEDGRVYREESKDMAARIRAGKLGEAGRA